MGLSVKSQAGAASDRDVHMEIGNSVSEIDVNLHQKCASCEERLAQGCPRKVPLCARLHQASDSWMCS